MQTASDFIALAVQAGMTDREIDAHLARLEYRARCLESFAFFAREAWPHIVPEELIWSWHLDAICEHLEAVTDGTIDNLLCNMPPGHAKSTFFSVLWPAWRWAKAPQWKLLSGSYDIDLAIRDACASRDLMKGEWYQSTLKPEWEFKATQDNKKFYQNTAMGHRVSTTPKGRGTGHRCNCWLVDDPLNVRDAYSTIERRRAVRWITKTLQSRLNTTQRRSRVLVMQRLHHDDPSQLLKQRGFVHLMLPTLFESQRRCQTVIGYTDPRAQEGELLFPDGFDEEAVEEAKKDLGSMGFAGQHQQRPSAEGGNIFMREHWSFWKGSPLTLDEEAEGCWVRLPQPHEWDRCAVTVDTSAGSESTTASFNIYHFWGIRGSLRFLLGEFRKQLSEAKLIEAFERFCALPELSKRGDIIGCIKWVEQKAAGPELIKQLEAKVTGLVAVNPKGSKEARARLAAPAVEAGNYILPDPRTHDWVDGVDGFIEELARFPGGSHDDRVDSLSMLNSQLTEPQEFTLADWYS